MNLKKIVGTAALTAAFGGFAIFAGNKILNHHGDYVNLVSPNGIVKVEIPEGDDGSGKCSEYVRRLGKSRFNKLYSCSDAWDRMYNDFIVAHINRNEDLRQLAKNRALKPGMLILAHYPKSKYNGGTDSRGNTINATHQLIYLGFSDDNDLVFAEHFGGRGKARKLSQFEIDGLEARAIIDSKD